MEEKRLRLEEQRRRDREEEEKLERRVQQQRLQMLREYQREHGRPPPQEVRQRMSAPAAVLHASFMSRHSTVLARLQHKGSHPLNGNLRKSLSLVFFFLRYQRKKRRALILLWFHPGPLEMV